MSDLIKHFDETAERYQQAILADNGRNVIPLSYVYYDAVRVWRRTNPGTKILDVGIGTGAATQMLREDGYDVYGVDGSPKMLELATKNGFPAEKLTLNDLAAKELKLPYDDATFSVVLTAASLLYLRNATAVVSEMLRVTQPNGLVLVDPLLHKNKKKGAVEYINVGRSANIPPVYIQNSDAFDQACRRGGGGLRQVLPFKSDIVDVIKPPLPIKHSVFAFIKR